MDKSVELDWLSKWNLYTPDKLAIKDISKKRSYTYKDFYQISNSLAFYLKSLGVQGGDRVAVLANNHVETIFLFFALQRLNAILVPINFRFAQSEVNYVMRDSGAKILFYEEEYSEIANAQEVQIVPMNELSERANNGLGFDKVYPFESHFQSACKILYTSGTTGFPKGVVITHKILFWNSINTTMSLNITSNDRMISFLPLFHTGAWNVLLTPFIHRGGTTIFIPKFDASQILKLCESEQITILFGVPTTLSMMTKTPEFSTVDLSSIRFAVVGGEPMSLGMIRTWHQHKVAIRQGFGLTECGPNCFSLSEKDAETKIGSIGRPNFYVETRIVDENNQDVEIDQVGELLLKGPMCMEEYWQNEEATDLSLVDGWLKTGDLVKRDQDNYFYVVGRKKEMFISGGENIYPAEVEKVLSTHPGIDEVAVLGIKDQKWGEVGKAFVVCKPNASITDSEIIQFCNGRLARYKIPKQFAFINELPKGSTGKILKQELQSHI